MFLPVTVEHHQHDFLFVAARDFLADQGHLGIVGLLEVLDDALEDILVGEILVLVDPLLDRQFLAELVGQGLLEALDIPLLLDTAGGNVHAEMVLQHIAAHVLEGIVDAVGAQQIVALGVDDLALVVGDIVVFEQVLANVEVVGFDLALRILDGLGHPGMFNRLAFLHAQFLHQPGHLLRREDTHQAVFHRQVETRGAGVALTSGATAQLVVDAAGFVTFGADDMQPTGLEYAAVMLFPGLFGLGTSLLVILGDALEFLVEIATEHDVGTTASHVGGDGYRTGAARIGDDLGLAFMLFGVQHLMLDAGLLEQPRQVFRNLDGGGADQYRLIA